jgi:hypothetical protein
MAGEDWVMQWIARQAAAADRKRRQATLAERADMIGPLAFKEISERFRSDVERYTSATRDSELEFKAVLGNGFTVAHHPFPAIALRFEIVAGSEMIFEIVSKKSASCKEKTQSGRVTLIAGSAQNDYHFIVEGDEVRDASDISERLLTRVFEFLAAD